MSGHSKWAGIKHKKAEIDAKRGKIFSKIAREIAVACKEGGSDPEKNSHLRLVLQKAKQYNMPSENIKRAIERSVKSPQSFETIYYEGFGPGGVAVIVTAQTDNKNRTTQEIRNIFSKHGGNLGEVGCVGWMFKKIGMICVEGGIPEEKLMEIVLSADAYDLKPSEDGFEITASPENLDKVCKSLEQNSVKIKSAEVINHPQTFVSLKGSDAMKMLRLMDELESHDDVVETAANFDIPEEILKEYESSGH